MIELIGTEEFVGREIIRFFSATSPSHRSG